MNKERNVSDPAFLQSLLVNFGVGAVVFLVFCLLRPRLRKVYAPRDGRQKLPPPAPDGFFSWIVPIIDIKDSQILDNQGLDAVMYQRFCRSMGICFFLMFIFSMLVLVPINVLGKNKERTADDPLFVVGTTITSLANVDSKSQKKLLWAHFVAIFLFSFVMMYFQYRDYRMFARMRAKSRRYETPNNYSVMVTGLPKGMRGEMDPKDADKNLYQYFHKYFSGKIAGAAMAVIAPQIRDWLVEFEENEKKLEGAQTELVKTGTRPLCRPTFWKIWQDKTDAITYYTVRRGELTRSITWAQNTATQKVANCGFVVFSDMQTSAICGQVNFDTNRHRCKTSPAPDPRDVMWENLYCGHISHFLRSVAVTLVMFFLVFFWTIPVLFAASLANIKAIAQLSGFGWLRHLLDLSPGITNFVSGLLPVLVVIVFFALLLTIIRAISGVHGFHLLSQLDNAVRNYYFAFLLFNLFFVYTIGGSFFLKIDNFLSANLSTFIQLLAQSIPSQAFFFTNYVVTNSAMAVSLMLLRPAAPIMYFIKKRFLAKTESDLRALDDPIPVDFVANYAKLSLLVVICLTYSTMFPLILLFGAIHFLYTYIVERYNIMYVYGPVKEGFGNMYPGAFNFITVGLIVWQITMFGVFSLFKFWQAPGLLILPFIAVIWHNFVKSKFARTVKFGSLDTLFKYENLQPGSKLATGIAPGSRIELLGASNKRLQLATEGQQRSPAAAESPSDLYQQVPRRGTRVDHNALNGIEVTLNQQRNQSSTMRDENWVPMLDADYHMPITEEQLHHPEVMYRNPYLPPERRALPNRYTLLLNSSDRPGMPQ